MASVKGLLDKVMNGHDLVVLRDWIKSHFVRKEANKGLSTHDLTDDLLAKVETAVTEEEAEEIIRRIDDGKISPDADVDAMLDDVFGATVG